MKTFSEVLQVAGTVSTVYKLDPFKWPDEVMGVARVYQKAFEREPWNEGYVCPVCRNLFANKLSLGAYCPVCQEDTGRLVKILRYWSVEKILTDFYREMLKPRAICLTMKDGCTVIAFAWGYEIEVSAIFAKKIEAIGLHNILEGKFMYLDECAVLPKWQNKGCGRMLLSEFRKKARRIRCRVLLRTLRGQVMYKLAKCQGGKVVQSISHDRVIMVISY